MALWSRRRPPNVGNILVVLGAIGLGVTLWVPYSTARRVARIETRAEEIGTLLLAVGKHSEPADLASAEQRVRIATAIRERCQQLGFPRSTIPHRLTTARGDGVYLEGKHYVYLLTHTPKEDTGTGERSPLEVYAWPRSALSAGQEVLFFPGDTDDRSVWPARSRNLHRGYHGLENPPRPGSARPNGETRTKRSQSWYRGQDEERWIELRHRGGHIRPQAVPGRSPQKNSNK